MQCLCLHSSYVLHCVGSHKFTINPSNFEANIFEMNIILTVLLSKEFTLTTPSFPYVAEQEEVRRNIAQVFFP